jgi:hypothetical protein
VSKLRYSLMGAEAPEIETALASQAPANTLAQMFVAGRFKGMRNSSTIMDLAPGQVLFDREEARLHVHDGSKVVIGRPSAPCPDCGSRLLLLKKRGNAKRSPYFYLCQRSREGCRCIASAYADGSIVGGPVDEKTRSARHQTRTLFDEFCKSVFALAYDRGLTAPTEATAAAFRWLAHGLDLKGRSAQFSSMDIPTLRRAWVLIKKGNPQDVLQYHASMKNNSAPS